MAQSWREDLVDFYRKLPIFDIVNPASERTALRAGKPGGRYIFGSTHSIAAGSKYDNFIAMLDEYEKHCMYYCMY